MVAHLCVIKDALVRFHPVVPKRLLREGIFDLRQSGFYRWQIIFRQSARIGARISDGLVFLVKSLGNLQGAFCRKPEAAVCLALEGRQVVELWGGLGARLLFFEFDNALFLAAFGLDGLCDLTVPQSRRHAV